MGLVKLYALAPDIDATETPFLYKTKDPPFLTNAICVQVFNGTPLPAVTVILSAQLPEALLVILKELISWPRFINHPLTSPFVVPINAAPRTLPGLYEVKYTHPSAVKFTPDGNANAVLLGTLKLSVVPSKYVLPYVAYVVLGTNGVVGLTVVLPYTVIANRLVELSKKRFDWQVSRLV